MKTSLLLASSAFILTSIFSSHVEAAGFTEIIPASACQLENEDDFGKADLVDGSWLIDASVANDQVELLCPVRTSHFSISGIFNSSLAWSDIEIFYRDPDGSGTGHSVVATLLQIGKTSGVATSLGSISSNSSIQTADTRWDESLLAFGTSLADAQHHVRVVLKQGTNNGTDRVRLTRVRLFFDPPGITDSE